jgi:hypothetical protein
MTIFGIFANPAAQARLYPSIFQKNFKALAALVKAKEMAQQIVP